MKPRPKTRLFCITQFGLKTQFFSPIWRTDFQPVENNHLLPALSGGEKVKENNGQDARPPESKPRVACDDVVTAFDDGVVACVEEDLSFCAGEGGVEDFLRE